VLFETTEFHPSCCSIVSVLGNNFGERLFRLEIFHLFYIFKMSLFTYWKLVLLILLWVSGWGFACVSFVSAITTYNVDSSIQMFLSGLIVHTFLPGLLLVAVALGFGLIYWHPKWVQEPVAIRPKFKCNKKVN